MNIKFKTGDRVVFLKMEYCTNTFFYSKSLLFRTVGESNDRLFTLEGANHSIDSHIAGVNEIQTYNQKFGTSLYGDKRCYHLEYDIEEIREIIRSNVKNALAEVKKEKLEKLSKINIRMQSLKEDIESIKTNNYDGLKKNGFKKFVIEYHKTEIAESIPIMLITE